MKYLMLEYAETPTNLNDFPKTSYSYKQNLNVLKNTNQPAIELLKDHLATETFTRVDSETADSDDNYQMSLSTQTSTFVDTERPDDDSDIHSIAMSLITGTTTKVEMESTDQD